MSFPYKHCLAIGATSGIGRALASRLIEAGIKVTVVGRRQERLDEFVNSHGHENANGVAFDIARLEDIPRFAAEYVHLRTFMMEAVLMQSITASLPNPPISTVFF